MIALFCQSAAIRCTGSVVRYPYYLALVVNADALTVALNSEVIKRDGGAVFPPYGVIR